MIFEIRFRLIIVRIAGIDENDVRINLMPIHLRGAILRIERIDSGAYAFIRNLKIERRY